MAALVLVGVIGSSYMITTTSSLPPILFSPLQSASSPISLPGKKLAEVIRYSCITNIMPVAMDSFVGSVYTRKLFLYTLAACHAHTKVLERRGHLLTALGYRLRPSTVLISEIVQSFILADFCYYYVKRTIAANRFDSPIA